MKIPTRLRKENENQAHYRLQWQSAFGKTILETFLDEQANESLKEKLNRWLDVLNYFDSDVAECAERNNDMRMYKKYEQVQDEMYNLIKGL